MVFVALAAATFYHVFPGGDILLPIFEIFPYAMLDVAAEHIYFGEYVRQNESPLLGSGFFIFRCPDWLYGSSGYFPESSFFRAARLENRPAKIPELGGEGLWEMPQKKPMF